MAAELRELIEKIQEEGVNAAKEKAKTIIDDAGSKAKNMVARAEKEASQIVLNARAEAKRTEESQKAALGQAARDLLLNVRAEINTLLDKIIRLDVGKYVSSGELPKLIEMAIRAYGESMSRGVIVSLNEAELEKLSKEFIRKLQDELKKEMILKPSEETRAGFVISFDAGRSQFDFSDKNLAEYIASFVRPKLAEILKEQAKDK